MKQLTVINDKYVTPEKPLAPLAGLLPSTMFYSRFLWIVYKSANKAKKGTYDDVAWVDSSFEVMEALEKVGVMINVEGLANIDKAQGPCVFIGNHMSMMETLLLPVMIMSHKKATFVVKESLLNYPVFKHVMRSRNPVAVSRTNPRQDLKTVMTEGVARIKDDISVIVFPQTTRSRFFDPEQMSTIGVKLAKKAGVPIVPIALKTDAWTNGKRFKDFGKIDINRSTHFAFGEPFEVEGKGGDEQARVNAFIQENLGQWR